MRLVPSRRTIVALFLLIAGSVATYNMWFPRDQRVGPDWLRGSIVLLGPVLLASGAVLLVLELAAWWRSGRTDAEPTAPSAHWPLWLGLIMLLIGGFPWAYLPLFFGPDGEEAWGMLGTIIFLLVGLPGVAVTGIGVSRMRAHRRRTRRPPIADDPEARQDASRRLGPRGGSPGMMTGGGTCPATAAA